VTTGHASVGVESVAGAAAAPGGLPVVGILVFDDVEVLDFAGPYEVLSATHDPAGEPYVRVFVVGAASDVACRGGLRIRPDVTLDACPPLDALIVPGGPGADERTPVQDEAILPFLRRISTTTPTLASVCTGAFLLGRAGLLDGRRVTTHRDALAALRAEFPSLEVVHEKVIDDGAIVTAAGVSSGIDLALHLLERWFGPQVRAHGAAGLDGHWV
jgi:transcriptional regulator GlxA family with amidase domain